MNEIIGKTNKSGSHLSTKLLINKNDVRCETGIANEFNKFFTNIGLELTRKIPITSNFRKPFFLKYHQKLSL